MKPCQQNTLCFGAKLQRMTYVRDAELQQKTHCMHYGRALSLIWFGQIRNSGVSEAKYSS